MASCKHCGKDTPAVTLGEPVCEPCELLFFQCYQLGYSDGYDDAANGREPRHPQDK